MRPRRGRFALRSCKYIVRNCARNQTQNISMKLRSGDFEGNAQRATYLKACARLGAAVRRKLSLPHNTVQGPHRRFGLILRMASVRQARRTSAARNLFLLCSELGRPCPARALWIRRQFCSAIFMGRVGETCLQNTRALLHDKMGHSCVVFYM